MWTKRIRWIMLGLAVMLPLAGCDDGTTGPGDGTATLSIYLTDGPGEVKVWVELLGLTAQGGEGGSVDLLATPTELILLTDLVGTVQFLDVNEGLDPTTFRQLRLVVGDVVLKALNDTVYVKGDPILPAEVEELDRGELQCPSCSQSGIKVKVPNDEMKVEGGSAALVLDFDVTQSFGHKAGNSGKWVMRPVILGALVEGDLEELGLAGSIAGTVTVSTGVTIPECPAETEHTIQDFVPTATLNGFLDGEGQPIVRTGTMGEGGTFQIGFLPSGAYTMGYLGSIDLGSDQLVFTADVTLGEVSVTTGEVTGVAYTIKTAACQAAG